VGGDRRPRPSPAALTVLVIVSIAIPAVLLALIVTHDGSGGRGSPATGTTSPIGDAIDSSRARLDSPAPSFRLPDTKGRALSLADLRGKPVVLAFFASWCHPCEEELPVLEQFAREHSGALQVVAINYRDLSTDSVDFVHRLGITYPALLDDPSAPVAQSYGVRGIPQTVFIDSRGVVRGRVYGVTSRRELAPAIDDLLAGRNVRPV
jgi:cytochrome c biogenesis protein CcmG, thiol:disulfide interchange protein DsbE